MSDWSVPETKVMQRVVELLEAERPAVLATIVDVEGSAYRRPGARMLIEPGSGGMGSITAGCLENEIKQLADSVRADGEPRLQTFDLMGDDVWGLGVGCNGIIDVLLEPLSGTFEPAARAYLEGRDCTVATVVAGSEGGLSIGDRAYGPDFDDFPAAVADELAELSGTGSSRTVVVETAASQVTVFLDEIDPPDRLVVIGSGHDVDPVVELATAADFRVTVVGYRGATTTDDRFPAADSVVSTSPRSLTEEVAFDEDTYAVVMNHNFIDDQLSVDALLETSVPYVGLMGPRERFDEMLDAFAAEDRALTEEQLDRLYTPVGLDLGGGTPNQIAQSIVAEVLAVSNGRSGGHLRGKAGPLHGPSRAVDGEQ